MGFQTKLHEEKMQKAIASYEYNLGSIRAGQANASVLSRVSFEYYGQQNDISKAFGSALTYSERYLLLKSLGAPTDEDDPDKHTDDKKQRQTTTPPPTQRPQNAPQERREKSKWAQVNDLIKDSEITLASVNEWILKSFGKSIKINNLTDEQFGKLMAALRKKIEGEMNE